jgi:hypothetical protein
MSENYPIHLTGSIYWLPSHRPGKPRFPTETIIRALAKFTADFTPSYTVLISYSSTISSQGLYEVRLSFPFGDVDVIRRQFSKSELLIMDAYKVIAVCRDLNDKVRSGAKMDDSWEVNK